jgi:uncharacterized protein (DUF934 family)
VQVIKDRKIISDEWQRVADDEAIPSGQMIISYRRWKKAEDEIAQHSGSLAICIDGDDEIEEVAELADQFELIALDFPTFADGRNYSNARLLRDRYAYKGDLRAVGDVLRDQLYYMHRCGITSFQVRADKSIEDALKAFDDFSLSYQTAADGAEPIYRYR